MCIRDRCTVISPTERTTTAAAIHAARTTRDLLDFMPSKLFNTWRFREREIFNKEEDFFDDVSKTGRAPSLSSSGPSGTVGRADWSLSEFGGLSEICNVFLSKDEFINFWVIAYTAPIEATVKPAVPNRLTSWVALGVAVIELLWVVQRKKLKILN